MGKLTKFNKDLFNLKNIKEVIKKKAPVVGLAAALFLGSMGLTGCQHDLPYEHEKEEPTIEQPTDVCTVCDGLQTEACGILHVCDDEDCLDHDEKAQKNGHKHDYCDEQECANEKVTDKDHQHDYCKKPGCDGIDGKEHGHCTDEYCDDFGKPYDDYEKEHGTNHKYPVEDQCETCDGLQTEPCGIKHTCDDEECLNYHEGKTYKEGHEHDYCNEGACKDINVTDKDHKHDYCGDETCLNTDKTSPDHEHDYCNEGDCKDINVTDKDHQHDYCKDCEGIDGKDHTCPVVEEPTLSAEVENIGNGTYSIANFMVDPGTTKIDEMVDAWLPNAERYIKDIVDSFSPEFKAKYNEELALIKDENAFKPNNDFGFDLTIERLNDCCAPIFEEIIENIDNDLDVAYFKNEYKGLSLKTYKKASGNYFDGNPAQDTYNTKLTGIETVWNRLHTRNGITPIFDIVEDIENNNCTNITTHMDELLLKHNIANDLGISKEDLKNYFDLTLGITSWDTMHDYAEAKGYSKHRSSCDGLDNELTK